jgi:osmotically-inducible protein OsmY
MTDVDLKHHIDNALEWEPSLDATSISVTVDHGVATLSGAVPTYAARAGAERTTLRVNGVKGVANELRVRLGDGADRNDTDIAHAAVNMLAWNSNVPRDHVTVSVADGWVTLKGTVEWQYQREAASRAVRDLVGVKGVTNDIVVSPRVRPDDIEARIQAAFRRSAEIDARRVHVHAQGGTVTLSGNVRSWFEREEAEHAVWAAPGVTKIDDRLRITP